MVDTAFYTPPAKLSRRAEARDWRGLVGPVPAEASLTPPQLEGGGGGLFSTLADYARFLGALSQGGALDGRRIVGPATLRFMTSDHLGAQVKRDHDLLTPGHGFGLGFAVRVAEGQAPTAGSVGEYYWGGFAGTAFFVSPRDELLALFMVQAPDYREYFAPLFRSLVYAALV
jgi:CubicO group peptidase (beta-lactamase class C family)